MEPGLMRCLAPIPRIQELIPAARAATDGELREMAQALKPRLDGDEPPDELLPEAFAIAGEAHHRSTGRKPTRQQNFAGIAVALGYVADLRDGAGKEVAVLLGAVMGALTGRGVHVMTSSDHLALRHAAYARQVCERLGLRVGTLTAEMLFDDRRANYRADITYGTSEQFAYDYLRDNLSWAEHQTVQRGWYQTIVDDADLVLIDDSLLPRIISVPAPEQAEWVRPCARLATVLRPDRHYVMPDQFTISLTDDGVALARAELGVDDIFDGDAIINGIRMALRAKERYERGRDYDVMDGQIVTLDIETGAALPRQHGLRQALEAKEDVPISPSFSIAATITARHYVRRYQHVAGISSAAAYLPEAFDELYDLEVVAVPRQPTSVVTRNDRLFLTDTERDDAVLGDALRRRENGQPVIIGTVTNATAERLTEAFEQIGVPVRTALGVDLERDIATLDAAGEDDAITVLASGVGRVARTAVDGVAVLGAGRHQSRRHDEPLSGLAGRDGTAGECAFFLSVAEMALLDGKRPPPDLPTLPEGGLSHGQLTANVLETQRHLDLMMLLRDVVTSRFDDVSDAQCDAVYEYRRRIVHGAGDIADDFRHMVDEVVDQTLADHGEALAGSDEEAIAQILGNSPIVYPSTVVQRMAAAPAAEIRTLLLAEADAVYRDRCDELDDVGGAGAAEQTRWSVLLSCIDRSWRDHLDALSQLYADVRSRSDSVDEFREEAQPAYERLWASIWSDAVGIFFHLGFEEDSE